MEEMKKREETMNGRITGCMPMSFGVMMRVVFLKETVLSAGRRVLLVHAADDKQVETAVINTEKDYTVHVTPTVYREGETGNVVLEYTEELLHFNLKDAGLSVVS